MSMQAISLLQLLLALAVWGRVVTGGYEVLEGPCKEWVQKDCDSERWVCTSIEEYERSRFQPHLHCPTNSQDPPTPPPPAPPPEIQCRLVGNTCQYTESTVSCDTWVPDCEYEYTCGTTEEWKRANSTKPQCPWNRQVPSPDMLCVPTSNSCRWYDPCHSWRGHCLAGYQCGTMEQYYAFIFSPTPRCAHPPEGWVEPIPPGECVIVNQQCGWSDCVAYTSWCDDRWICGTEYNRSVYHSSPPPPCPPPPPNSNHTPPAQPGPCQFDVSAGSCQFQPDDTTTASVSAATQVRNGPCVNGTCPRGETCDVQLDWCLTNNCGDKNCPAGQYCPNGECVPNPCYLVDCLPHQYCQNGTCINYTCGNFPYCRDDQLCEMVTHGCGPGDGSCFRHPQCTDTPEGPPAVDPVPRVDPSTLLLSLLSPQMDNGLFVTNKRKLLDDIELALEREGFHVTAQLHKVLFIDGQMQVVVAITGVNLEGPAVVIEALRVQPLVFNIDIESYDDQVDADVRDNGDGREETAGSEEAELSHRTSIFGIGVIGLVMVLAVIAVCMTVMLRDTPVKAAPNNNRVTAAILNESRDPEKGKLIVESVHN